MSRLFSNTSPTRSAAAGDSLADCRPDSFRQLPTIGIAIDHDHEVAILDILEAPRSLGVGASDDFARKEHALRALFATFSVLESLSLHKRLTINRHDDQLAIAFRRMVSDRRDRLFQFLLDSKRRAALQGRR
jgi:hypothetical protein